MTRSARVQELSAALAELGSTVPDVVDSLLLLGICGAPGEPRRCPVAQYLNRRFPGAAFDVTTLDVFDANDLGRGVPTPTAVGLFVFAFDHGDIPELVSADEPALCVGAE